MWLEEPRKLKGTGQEQYCPQAPRTASGLLQALLQTPHWGGLEVTSESHRCQGASSCGCRRQEARTAARSSQGQGGQAGQAGLGT